MPTTQSNIFFASLVYGIHIYVYVYILLSMDIYMSFLRPFKLEILSNKLEATHSLTSY